jgi:RND family efflux transporter MFP subunit
MADVGDRLEAGGLVAAGESAVVSSRLLAPITEVRVRAGDRVRADQVLVVLDERDLRAQTRQADAAVAAAEQALSAARSERSASEAEDTLASAWHRRIAALQERNSATAQELDDARARLSAASARSAGASARVEQASAQLEAARAAAEGAEAVRSFTTIRAPFDGVVTERLMDPGNLAAPGTPLLRLDAGGARKVVAQVDAARAPYVQVGDRVHVLFDGGPDGPAGTQPVEGIVGEIARTVSADSRTFTVDVTLPPEVAVRTGTFARVRFEGAPRQALVVPAGALRRQGQIASVFVVEDGVARLRLLQTGSGTDTGVEVLAGLNPGERVVTNPPADLTDGRAVLPAPPDVRGDAP